MPLDMGRIVVKNEEIRSICACERAFFFFLDSPVHFFSMLVHNKTFWEKSNPFRFAPALDNRPQWNKSAAFSPSFYVKLSGRTLTCSQGERHVRGSEDVIPVCLVLRFLFLNAKLAFKLFL